MSRFIMDINGIIFVVLNIIKHYIDIDTNTAIIFNIFRNQILRMNYDLLFNNLYICNFYIKKLLFLTFSLFMNKTKKKSKIKRNMNT